MIFAKDVEMVKSLPVVHALVQFLHLVGTEECFCANERFLNIPNVSCKFYHRNALFDRRLSRLHYRPYSLSFITTTDRKNHCRCVRSSTRFQTIPLYFQIEKNIGKSKRVVKNLEMSHIVHSEKNLYCSIESPEHTHVTFLIN